MLCQQRIMALLSMHEKYFSVFNNASQWNLLEFTTNTLQIWCNLIGYFVQISPTQRNNPHGEPHFFTDYLHHTYTAYLPQNHKFALLT
jgi:hypothetical protein